MPGNREVPGVQVIEAYSRLRSLRQSVPDQPVSTKFVAEFHQILDLLEASSGARLDSFRIPAAEIRPVETGGNYLSGETYYSAEPYCDRSFFLMKVDAALMMFELLGSGSGQKQPIGFKPPTE